MAGMFYSLQEAAEKLNMSEQDVQKLVEERKLREFRDGSNVLFKVDEVEGLMSDTGVLPAETAAEEPQEELTPEPQATEETLEPEPEAAEEPLTIEAEATEEEPVGLVPEATEEETLEPEPEAAEEPLSIEAEATEEEPIELVPEAAEEEPLTPEPEPVAELGDQGSGAELTLEDSLAMLGEPVGGEEEPTLDDSLALLGDLEVPGKETPAEPKTDDTEVSLSLDGDTASGIGDELTNADTAITKEGISVLDESDGDFKLSDDTAAETKAMQEATSLEKIEGDINLDSFGGGSGLLDLSLQADDTSLGGILDEIYTPEGDEGAVPSPDASAADVAAEAEQMLAQDQLAGAPVVMGYVEPEPDASSNIFGFLLLLPLLVVVYTLMVTVAGQFGVLSSLVPSGMTIIYALVGVGVVAGIVAGYGAMQGAPAKPKKPKQPKPKKEKAPKVKKEKKKK